jgi:peptidoglycan/LPS O-acetylase OafA/YrhL
MSNAAIRRYPRLAIPVLFSVVLTWVAYNLGWMSNRELAVALGQSDQSWLHKLTPFSGDLFQALKSGLWTAFFSFDESSSYNPVLWTMEIELLGSFFLFCFLCLFGKSRKRWVFYAAALFVCSALSLYGIDAFILGALLCDLYVTRPDFAKSGMVKRATHRIFIGLSHPMASVILFIPTLAMIGLPNYQGVFHLLLATALTGFVVVNDLSRRIFSSRILMFLGKISFGFYLGHPLVIAVLGNPIFAFLVRYCSPTLAALVSCVLLGFCSTGFGWMIWRLADDPAVNLSKRFAKMLQ